MADITWTVEAQRWLREIHEYIADDNPFAAANVVEGIYYRAQVLSEFPRIGHRYEVHPDREVRILLYGHYRIAYLLKHDKKIDILGVFHGAMEIERYIKQLNPLPRPSIRTPNSLHASTRR